MAGLAYLMELLDTFFKSFSNRDCCSCRRWRCSLSSATMMTAAATGGWWRSSIRTISCCCSRGAAASSGGIPGFWLLLHFASRVSSSLWKPRRLWRSLGEAGEVARVDDWRGRIRYCFWYYRRRSRKIHNSCWRLRWSLVIAYLARFLQLSSSAAKCTSRTLAALHGWMDGWVLFLEETLRMQVSS